MSSGRKSFSISADLSSLDRLLDQLGDEVEAATRPAAQAAAQVLYDEVKRNVAGIGKVTGNLERSIYQAFSASNSASGKATYHVSWNHRKAPHGWLVENGHMQRYRSYQDNQGRVRTMVRPGMDGTLRPGRRASQAEKDAYYVPLPGGPRHVAARPFVRPAQASFPKALEAAEAELLKRINGGKK
ncbi:hypothetical protein D3C72_514080 [compost metagenome]